MELKPYQQFFLEYAHPLLIVPYGIETKSLFVSVFVAKLLIVPYGIETVFWA